MSEFPKWLLALAFLSLVPLLACPLYLFGGHPIGTSDNAFLRFLLYIATQLLWLVPTASFFFTLDAWRRGYEKLSITYGCIGLLISVVGLFFIFS